MPRLAWFFGATITFAGLVLPQVHQAQTPSTQPTFRLGVNVVQVDVSVLDDKRRPVRDLTAADFTYLEDGNLGRLPSSIPLRSRNIHREWMASRRGFATCRQT